MATHDYVIDNQTAPNFRADLNNALLAIVSNNSSATQPAVTYANMMWYDAAENILYMRNEDNDAWIRLGTLDQTSDTFAAAVALASQAEAEAGTDNAKVMTPLRVKQSVDANVGVSAAAIPYAAVGSYVFAAHGDPATFVSAGSTVAGSSLRPTGAMYRGNFATGGTQVVATLGTALSGTWRCMGVSSSVTQAGTASISNATLFLRVS